MSESKRSASQVRHVRNAKTGSTSVYVARSAMTGKFVSSGTRSPAKSATFTVVPQASKKSA